VIIYARYAATSGEKIMISETNEQGAAEIKSSPVKKIEATKAKPNPNPAGVLSALGLMLLEILLPALTAGGVLLWLFGGYNIWQVGRSTALVIFAIVMVVMAFLLAVVLDTLSAPFRATKKMKSVRFARDPRTRIVKLALGGLVVPLLVFGAVNLTAIRSHGTLMNYLITAAVPPVKLTPPDEVGSIALKTDNPSTKLLSIQVLQGFQSPEALNQLVRLVNEDSGALADPGVAYTLSKAIAGYGAQARDPLLISFKSIDPQKGGSFAGINSDLYDRYFSQSFESLKNDIGKDTLNQAEQDAQLAQLQSAQALLKTSLTNMGYKPVSTAVGDPRPDFILRTFLEMDIQQDVDLLAFAKATAADTRYSSQVRGDALLLIGKLGEQKDADLLYTYLKNNDDLLVARALQAIAVMQSRLGKTSK
jgi:hypothetical protein